MFSNRPRLFLPAALCLAALVTATSARADLITEHATAAVSGVFGQVGGGQPGVISDGPNSGSVGAEATAHGAFPGSSSATTVEGAGTSSAVLRPSGGAKSWLLNAHAEISVSNGVQGTNDGGVVDATATWRDVIYLSSTDPAIVGNTVRLHFFSNGALSADTIRNNYASSGTASVSVSANGRYRDLYGSTGASVALSGFDALNVSGWDDIGFTARNHSVPSASYRGLWHLDIPIDSGLGYMEVAGALYYEVALNSHVDAQGNFGRLSASDPFAFAAITLPDVGDVTPESLGITVTTDSGTVSPNLAAVPEPASLTMLGIGIVGMLGYGLRRRMARRA